VQSSSALPALSESTGAPQRKKQKTSEVVRQLIDESAKIFTGTVAFFVCLLVFLFVYSIAYLFICLLVCLFACLFVRLFA
jgi:hypothetical protein